MEFDFGGGHAPDLGAQAAGVRLVFQAVGDYFLGFSGFYLPFRGPLVSRVVGD
jgi:hypothetical protein